MTNSETNGAAVGSAPRTGAAGRTLLILLCLAQFMLILDVAVVAVAVPSIQGEFGVPTADIQWVSTAYSLAFGGFLVSSGRAADLFGPKRILLVGITVFTIGSALCGFAGDALMLFIARAIQGFGAALVSPAALTLVTTSFGEGEGRNKALGIWGAVSSGGAIAGQLLGGVLTDLAGWRSIFLINLPIGLVVAIAVIKIVRRDPPRGEGRTDVFGASLLTAGVVLLVAAVSQLAEHGASALVLIAGSAGILVLVAFVLYALRASNPIIRLSMFRNGNVRYGNLICVLTSGAATVSVFFSSLYLQRVLGYSPLQAGMGFAPVTLVILVISSRTGSLVQRFGVRTLLLGSAVLTGVGAVLLSLAPADGNYWAHVLPGLVISGAGAALSFAPAMIVSTTGVADNEQGLASGLLSTSQQIGAALWLAILNTVVASVIASAPDGTSREAMTSGFQAGFLWLLVVPVLTVLCVLALPRTRTTDQAAPAGH
ncbi:EmrB/QacA subfamily drug resistance transporter [Kibdelosporangium banguiense]|uniref:EmrB/QacA subfamily drug resistance transporter n=1 Tax=Kibdelosporangium banguiense TaxID=1365924 RepID=A0ABS4TYD8_9PSEU|nr:DHA2 family efflux MFS transporter permease subunit [Kibdelosporangium banguiense]MBP2329392.1 EmrB/QacA subfamily drug resistance transporter [Kibdelosporangium banguiense]